MCGFGLGGVCRGGGGGAGGAGVAGGEGRTSSAGPFLAESRSVASRAAYAGGTSPGAGAAGPGAYTIGSWNQVSQELVSIVILNFEDKKKMNTSRTINYSVVSSVFGRVTYWFSARWHGPSATRVSAPLQPRVGTPPARTCARTRTHSRIPALRIWKYNITSAWIR